MRYIALSLAGNLATLGFLGIAALLICKGMNGWGWCLFLALLCASSIKLRD